MDCLDAMTNDFPEFADVLDNTFLSLSLDLLEQRTLTDANTAKER
jgi:hypothetical protein